jgi:hypothetical protein
MKKLIASLGLAGLLAANLAAAHPDHDAAPMRMRAVELSAKATASGASIQVTEGGKAVSTAGATGSLTLAGAGQKAIPLTPAGGNTMVATSAVKIAPGTKAQATIVFDETTMSIIDVTVN